MCDRNALEREKEKKKGQFEKDTLHWQFFLERHWVIDKVSKSWGGEGNSAMDCYLVYKGRRAECSCNSNCLTESRTQTFHGQEVVRSYISVTLKDLGTRLRFML